MRFGLRHVSSFGTQHQQAILAASVVIPYRMKVSPVQVAAAKTLIDDVLRRHGREASLTPVFLKISGEWIDLDSTVEEFLYGLDDVEDHDDFVLDTPQGMENVTEIGLEEGSLLLTVERLDTI